MVPDRPRLLVVRINERQGIAGVVVVLRVTIERRGDMTAMEVDDGLGLVLGAVHMAFRGRCGPSNGQVVVRSQRLRVAGGRGVAKIVYELHRDRLVHAGFDRRSRESRSGRSVPVPPDGGRR